MYICEGRHKCEPIAIDYDCFFEVVNIMKRFEFESYIPIVMVGIRNRGVVENLVSVPYCEKGIGCHTGLAVSLHTGSRVCVDPTPLYPIIARLPVEEI